MIRKSMLLLVALLAATACQKSSSAGGGAAGTESLYAQSDNPDNLKGLMQTIVSSAASGDVKKAAALTRGLIPDKAALDKALKDDAPAGFKDNALKMGEGLPPDDAKVATLIRPGEPARTQINVHGATTEEISKYEQGSVAFNEFPGGAKKLADQVLRPGVKFYEVEFVEPGRDAGMKYHMFFWDGGHWRMLGPAWRGLQQ